MFCCIVIHIDWTNQHRVKHKVRTYKEYHSVCPSHSGTGLISEMVLAEVGSAACFSGPQYTISQLCFRSAQNAITQCFQICQCAMRNAAIADTSATHNHSKESKRGRLVALLFLLLTQVHIAVKKTTYKKKIVCGTVAAISFFTEKKGLFLLWGIKREK